MGQYHLFEVYESTVRFFDKDTVLFETNYPGQWDANQPTTLGLEAKGGLYTLFVNGIPTDTAQITPYGNQVGISMRSGGYWKADGRFDSLTVRQSR